jgi:hypothetical protein
MPAPTATVGWVRSAKGPFTGEPLTVEKQPEPWFWLTRGLVLMCWLPLPGWQTCFMLIAYVQHDHLPSSGQMEGFQGGLAGTHFHRIMLPHVRRTTQRRMQVLALQPTHCRDAKTGVSWLT